LGNHRKLPQEQSKSTFLCLEEGASASQGDGELLQLQQEHRGAGGCGWVQSPRGAGGVVHGALTLSISSAVLISGRHPALSASLRLQQA